MLAKLKKVVDKQSKPIYILADSTYDSDRKSLLSDYPGSVSASIIDDFDNASTIIIMYRQYDSQTLKFINRNLDKGKTLILVASKDLDFDAFVNNTIAKSINTIMWPKSKEYIIQVE